MGEASTSTRGHLHIVEDPADSAELARLVSSLADRARGRVVCHTTPGCSTDEQLASDLLVAVGKRFDALRFERVRRGAWELSEVWMVAEDVVDLFVLRAHALPLQLLHALGEMSRRNGIETWLIDSSRDAGAGVLDRMRAARWSPTRFRTRWESARNSADRLPRDQTPYPELPSDGFLTFRATCRRLLVPGDFDRVDALYRESMATTIAWLKPRRARPRAHDVDDSLERDAIAAQIQRLLSDAASTSEALVRFRAAQAACFLDGWFIDFHPTVVDTACGMAPLGPELCPASANRLRRLCGPVSTAAMALRLATSMRSEILCRLNIDDLADDGGGVTIEGQLMAVPDHARSLVRAHLVARQRQGGSGADPFFVGGNSGGRSNASALRNIVRSASRKTGLSVGARDTVAMNAGGWLLARGARIHRMRVAPAVHA